MKIEQIEGQAKMKKWSCNGCGKEIEVEESYEPEMCCSGLREACGCMGLPTNPIFCDDCERKFFGKNSELKKIDM